MKRLNDVFSLFRKKSSLSFRNNSKKVVLLLVCEKTVVELVVRLAIMCGFLEGQDRFVEILEIFRDFGVDVLAGDDDAVGVVDGGLGQVDVVSLLEILQVFGIHARKLHFLVEAGVEAFLEGVVIYRIDDFGLVEERVVADVHGTLDVDRHEGREPAVTVDDVGRPVLLLHRFDNATVEEDGAVVVLFAEIAFFVIHEVFFLREEIVVFDEINLHPRLLDGSHLDDKGIVGVVDDEVHSRKADDLVELVAPVVDDTIAGHKNSDFLTAFLGGLGQVTADEAHRCFRQIGGDFLMDEKYSCLACHVRCSWGLKEQSYEFFPN